MKRGLCADCGRYRALQHAGHEDARAVHPTYAGNIARNVKYARACVADSVARGEAPFASHLIYTQPGILDDTDPDERRQGIEAGLEWGRFADLTAVYTDLGLSEGMRLGLGRANHDGRRVEFRNLAPDWESNFTARPTYAGHEGGGFTTPDMIERDALAARVERTLSLHAAIACRHCEELDCPCEWEDYCRACEERYPCPTVRALGGEGVER